LILFCALVAIAMASEVSPEVVKALAPSGRLRAAINYGNPVLAQKDLATSETRGVSPALARALATPEKRVAFREERSGRSRKRIGMLVCTKDASMSERKTTAPVVPEGWTIQATEYHRSLGYWFLVICDLLLSLGSRPMPPASSSSDPGDVTYTMRRDADGLIRKIRLRGDHAPDALAETIGLIQSDASA
jgi:hypothetical protein